MKSGKLKMENDGAKPSLHFHSPLSIFNFAMELVVARYREDLSWLANIPPQIRTTVYDKSGDKSEGGSTPGTAQLLSLPNVGREAHTYLHHIHARYETLAPLTVFCQGKPFDHAFNFHKTLRELASGKTLAEKFFWLGHVADTDSPSGILFENWSKNPARETLDLNAFHRALFGCDGPQEYPFFGGAQFIVSREKICERPKTFYENALQISVQFPHAAHCFERTWDRVFSAQEQTAARMNGEKTRYFKPIRKLETAPEAD
jgi:hypothetical protein